MKPVIYFHDIASIELEPIQSFFGEHVTFYNRCLVLRDAAGRRLEIGLFAATHEALLTRHGNLLEAPDSPSATGIEVAK